MAVVEVEVTVVVAGVVTNVEVATEVEVTTGRVVTAVAMTVVDVIGGEPVIVVVDVAVSVTVC